MTEENDWWGSLSEMTQTEIIYLAMLGAIAKIDPSHAPEGLEARCKGEIARRIKKGQLGGGGGD